MPNFSFKRSSVRGSDRPSCTNIEPDYLARVGPSKHKRALIFWQPPSARVGAASGRLCRFASCKVARSGTVDQ